jgi:hypothetical protein
MPTRRGRSFTARRLYGDGTKKSMREYDNVDYRYKSSDGASERAVAFVSEILGFRPDPAKLEYDLNFFSGGIGVDDKLAFSCTIDPQQLPTIIDKLELVPPLEAAGNKDWGEDFSWLLEAEPDSSIETCALEFINGHKKAFQSPPAEGFLFFARESNLNTWTAVWQSDGKFNYLYSDQG